LALVLPWSLFGSGSALVFIFGFGSALVLIWLWICLGVHFWLWLYLGPYLALDLPWCSFLTLALPWCQFGPALMLILAVALPWCLFFGFGSALVLLWLCLGANSALPWCRVDFAPMSISPMSRCLQSHVQHKGRVKAMLASRKGRSQNKHQGSTEVKINTRAERNKRQDRAR
jgi:hypothetical protein